jgi:hypothetical protein
MAKVKVKLSGGDVWIHHFLTLPEAQAYVLALREMDSISHVPTWLMSVRIDGKEA